ncbi:hypothetical protein DERP_012902 [Dermatophagoides pteronyssinus]|uniref:Uncharacterized protein n=1 Tax=Dermatophagoides pteronyssinus TaxID=6956 RepID=A0ABQ8J1P9_DERPT|nr:hypothetical protein DERP_012902 [Dermatophagoides pteronyssinus]
MTLAGYMNVTLILTKLRHKKWKILLKHDKNQDVLDSFKTGTLNCTFPNTGKLGFLLKNDSIIQ